MSLLGIDYGGTNTKLLLTEDVPDGANILRRATVATPRGADPLALLAHTVEEFLAGDEPDAFGLTIAGVIDEHQGRVRVSTNLPWLDGRAPAEELAGLLGSPGASVHDGAAAALAEARLGAGRGADDVFVLALGTGVAGAHVVDRKVRRGAHGAAGEIGHVAMGGERLCSCGQTGCLETEIGGARLAARWREASGGDATVTSVELVEAAAAGDRAAIGILDRATSMLAQGLLAVVAIVDPGMIVIGGGLAAAREWIVDPAIAKAGERATFHRVPPVAPAALGRWAGAWGGALAAADVREVTVRRGQYT